MLEVRNMFPEGTTTRKVIDFATVEFFKKGVRQVTMDDIAKGLQMSKRTLYQLFADKEQLIIASIEVLAEKEQRLVRTLLEEQRNVLEIILRIIEHRLKTYVGISASYSTDIMRYASVVEYIAIAREEAIKRSVAFFEEGTRQGLLRTDVNFDIVIRAMLQKIDSAFCSDDPVTYSPLDYLLNICLFHLRGCCTNKGIELVDTFIEHYRQEYNDHLDKSSR